MACDSDTKAEMAAVEAELADVRAAIKAILLGAQSYRLDTSQTAQTVTRADLGALRLLRSELQEELRALRSECGGAVGTHIKPAF